MNERRDLLNELKMIKAAWKKESGQLKDQESEENEEKCREYEIKLVEMEDDIESMGIELKEM